MSDHPPTVTATLWICSLLIKLLPVDLPLLSDHAFIVHYSRWPTHQAAARWPTVTVWSCIRRCNCSAVSDMLPSLSQVCNWHQLDVEVFTVDLVGLELIVSPLNDMVSTYKCYKSTFRVLLDKHVPLQSKCIRTRASAPRYNREYREVKHTTHRLGTEISLTTYHWHNDCLTSSVLHSMSTLNSRNSSRSGPQWLMCVKSVLVTSVVQLMTCINHLH